MNKKRFFHIKTIGCQMNSFDSQTYRAYLLTIGMQEVLNMSQADLILVNTCAVRQKSVDKAKNLALQLSYLKRRKPVSICLLGCASSMDEFRSLTENGYLDYRHGPLNAMSVPEDFIQFIKSCSNIDPTSSMVSITLLNSISAQVPIIHGCNSFCSYCIVPLVRGRERSVPEEELMIKIHSLIQQGVRELVLLGQNVNHYGMDINPQVNFRKLLEKIATIEGLARIDFITSHPRNFDLGILEVIQNHPNIYQHFHLPLQSGDDDILLAMKRGYTISQYLELIRYIRTYFPRASLTTDIIVGFPGEDAQHFANTISLVEEVQFDTIYAAVYSHRPGTLASSFPHLLDENKSKERLNSLLEHQRKISHLRIQRFIDTTNQVLILRKLSNQRYLVKTIEEKTMNMFSDLPLQCGDTIEAHIESLVEGQLEGKAINQ